MKSVLIVGYGVVGKNLHDELKILEPDIYDKYKIEFKDFPCFFEKVINRW